MVHFEHGRVPFATASERSPCPPCWGGMKPRDRKGAARRKIVAERTRAFFCAVTEQAPTDLPGLRERIEQPTQQQPLQQQQSKAKPKDKT